MTRFRDKGSRLCAYSTVGQPTVFRFCTGFPCSAEQECVSFGSSVRVAHLPQSKPGYISPSKDGCFLSPMPPCSHEGGIGAITLPEGGASGNIY